jgi:GNAT superfamily N-acetyltransferase
MLHLALAVEGHRRVGAITLHRHPVRGKYGLIEPMNIHPDYQGQGVGRRMWEFVASRSRELGDRGLQVWALDRCDIAIHFYRDTLGLPVIGPGEWWLRDHREPATGFQDNF